MDRRDEVAAELPLRPDTFRILLALEDGSRHGYAILKQIEQATDGAMRLSPSPFYRKLKRLAERGLVREEEERPAPDLDDDRRRYYALTERGRVVLKAEAVRLVGLAGSPQVMRLAGTDGRGVT